MSAAKPAAPSTWKQTAWWYALGAACVGVGYLVQSPYMAYAGWSFLLLLALAGASSRAWVSGIDCERSVSPTTLHQGEEAAVDVTLTNRRGWPIPWIFAEDLHPKDFPRAGAAARLAILMPGQSIRLRYTLTCPRRGYHRIGPTLYESGDLFGLQKRFRTGETQTYISVLPTVAYIETFTISAKRPQGPVRISNRIYEDPTRIAGLREYVPGDPLNRIHWKASARTGQLYVKQNEPSNVLGATLALDFFEDAYRPEERERRMELAVTTAASLAYLLHSSGEQVGLITNALDAAEAARYEVESRQILAKADVEQAVVGEGENDRLNPLAIPTMRSPIQAMRIIENLARVLPGHGLAAEDLILNNYRGLPRDAALIAILPAASGRMAEVLAEMKIAGFAVTALIIRDQAAYEEAVGRLAPFRIDALHIESEASLHELNPARIGR